MTRVDWLQSALDELTRIWMQADAAGRARVTASAHQIDERLARDPLGESESRVGRWRVIIELPLIAYSRYDAGTDQVRIPNVRRVPKRPST